MAKGRKGPWANGAAVVPQPRMPIKPGEQQTFVMEITRVHFQQLLPAVQREIGASLITKMQPGDHVRYNTYILVALAQELGKVCSAMDIEHGVEVVDIDGRGMPLPLALVSEVAQKAGVATEEVSPEK